VLFYVRGRPACSEGLMSEKEISAREFVIATAMALFLGIVLSMAAVYGLNRYFDGHDEALAEFAVPSRGR
jgi:hypothetical protein